MKMNISLRRLKNISLISSAILLVLTLNSCATKANFLSSSMVPAANGTVKVKKDKNHNYRINIQISNLAESNQLSPPKDTYVVWLVADNKAAKNIGQIVSETGFMSKKLKASFETITSFKPSKIFLTAEDDANVQYSYSEAVLTTGDF
ncbi:MAG: hypothetical protein CVT92_16140 [Bacteroidetes bacterium HGW-Bacteroidetes-1]|jgi:hypothetical protein|nr:MAG: hypothetical protein CVT92_16140 [Bacteroidetes bacterium HGW-Bacteroidetes-1]